MLPKTAAAANTIAVKAAAPRHVTPLILTGLEGKVLGLWWLWWDLLGGHGRRHSGRCGGV
jgi:hypothetical protein